MHFFVLKDVQMEPKMNQRSPKCAKSADPRSGALEPYEHLQTSMNIP